jgi:2-dehydropantoate 2-reductase
MSAVAVVGVGAVGGFFGAQLIRTGHHRVVLCVRQPFSVLRLESPVGDIIREVSVLTNPSGACKVDWVLLATKAHQTTAAKSWLERLCGSGTRVAVLQNGVDHVERVAPLAPGAEVLPTVPYCDVTATAPGYIIHRGGGSLVVPASAGSQDLCRIFEGTAAQIVQTSDFVTAAWTKLCRCVATSPINTLTGQRHRVLRRPEIAWLAMGLVAECIEVGRQAGARFGPARPDEVVDLSTFASNSGSSMREDRLAGRPLEYDAQNGTVVRLGELYGIPTPLNRAVTALLAAISDAAPADAGDSPSRGAGTSRS